MIYRKIKLLIILLTVQMILSYEVGDVVNIIDQNKTFDVCYNGEGEFKLANYNGDLNGGHYYVILIDMSATWCGPCYSLIPYFDDVLETWNIGKGFEDPFEPTVTRGQRIARAGKNAIVGQKVDYSRPTYPTLQQLAAGDRTNLTEQDVLNMYKDEGLISPTDYKSGMKLSPGELTWWRMQNPGRGIWGTQYNADGGRAGYMGGGIAAIRKPNALPPTGGPQSGGLPSLYNNGRKL